MILLPGIAASFDGHVPLFGAADIGDGWLLAGAVAGGTAIGLAGLGASSAGLAGGNRSERRVTGEAWPLAGQTGASVSTATASAAASRT